MRLLVDANDASGSPRLFRAAWCLAGRGHDVAWLGPAPSEDAKDVGKPRLVNSSREAGVVDVLIGSAKHLLRSAWAGWMAGAPSAVLSLDERTHPGFAGKAAWGMLDTIGLVEPRAGDDPRVAFDDLGHERLELWGAEPMPLPLDVTHEDVDRLERACERLTSRRRGHAPKPAVFLDRDGTLVVERGYLANPDDIELLPGVAQGLRSLKAAGYTLVVVSNQSGVGRGLFALATVYAAMARLRIHLRRDGVELDAVYFCPHRPDAGCACRKPGTKLLADAAANLGLSLRDSAMVGDKLLDVATAHRAGARGVLVRSGYGRDEQQRLSGDELDRPPDLVVDDLAAAVPWLLERHPSMSSG